MGMGSVFEQVYEAESRFNAQKNLYNYDINSVKSRLKAELTRKFDQPQSTSNTNLAVIGLIEKFEKKMKQKITDAAYEMTNELTKSFKKIETISTNELITNEISKTFKKIEALSEDNVEYLED